MPGQKRKYNVRFPPGRIKKIMQKDTEVGRIATAVPVIISRALEIFLKSFLTKTSQITQSKHSRVMSIGHMKECIEAETLFDFLKNLVEQASVPSPLRPGRVKGKWPGHSNRREARRRWPHFSGKAKQHEPADRSRRPNDEPLDNPEHLNDAGSELFICLGAK